MRRRDRQSEVVVAVVVVSALALAFTFGLVLTLGSQSDETATPLAGATVSSTSTNIAEPTEMATTESTEETPDATPTEAMDVSESGSTETATATASLTRTRRPTRTNTEAFTDEPTSTRTRRPIRTSTETLSTTASPTRTPRPSRTSTPSATASRTATDTATASRTPHPTRTPNTPSITPSNTPFPSLTITPFTPLPTIPGCVPNPAWLPYIVQSGDILFELAFESGLSTQALRDGNCIEGSDIDAGQIILLPPTSPLLSTPTLDTIQVEYCENPFIQIISPSPGARRGTSFAVRGIANADFFAYYTLGIKPEGGDFYLTIYESNQRVASQNELGTITIPPTYSPGSFWLRLQVYNPWGDVVDQCAVRFFFE